jgi:hypothetical protein|tara:strand:+ start:1908 stop:2150 length:243 start_codon:yes stop_codon:yes gene_type:complete
MTTEEKQYLDDLTDDFKPIVDNIEKGIKTTKNNYAKYGQALSYFSDGCPDKALTLMLVLKRAGANMQGLTDGYRAFIKSD